jgi:hypothetical protein
MCKAKCWRTYLLAAQVTVTIVKTDKWTTSMGSAVESTQD